MYSKILVGTDGSETASRAVARAVDIASGLGAELLVVTAHPAKAAEAARKVLDRVESEYGERARVRGISREGHNPADVLIDVAEEEGVDVIVVGNKGMTGVSRLLGSVPNRVSHNASTSVLIVRTTGG